MLKLAKADFDAGFLGDTRGGGVEAALDLLGPVDPALVEEAARRAARRTLLRFIQLVTGAHETRTLSAGEPLFRAGDRVDELHIVSEGTLNVHSAPPMADTITEAVTEAAAGAEAVEAGAAAANEAAGLTAAIVQLKAADVTVGLSHGRSGGGGGGVEAALELLGDGDPALIEEIARRHAPTTMKAVEPSGGPTPGMGVAEAEGAVVATDARTADATATAAVVAPPAPRHGQGRVSTLARVLTRQWTAGPAAAEPAHAASLQPVAEVRPGECCGEIALLAGRATHSKSVVCASERCTLVSVRGDEFLRLVRKSPAVRESFEQLSKRRSEQNRQAQRSQ